MSRARVRVLAEGNVGSTQVAELRALRRLARLACAWALLYAAYRGYYALGGTFGIFGTPVSDAAWRRINGLASVLLVLAAVLGALAPRLHAHLRAWGGLVSAGWLITVGCVMHALVNGATRILSLAGVLRIDYPFFTTIDRRAADLQDLLLNEPWFLVEGLLWGALCLRGMRSGTSRRRFVVSAVAAIAVLTIVGMLSATGVIGRVVVG